jgi:integrase
MRGSIIRRGAKWAVIVDVGRDAKGGRKQRWHSGYETKRDASRALTEILATLQAGSYVEPSKQTVRQFADEWLDAVQPTIRASTLASYRLNVLSYIVPRVGDVPLQQLTASRLNKMYADLLATGRRDGERGLGARTVGYVHTLAHRMLRDAVRWGRVTRNVADQADPPRTRTRPPMKIWNATDLRIFLEHVAEDRLYAAWLLSATTGMRRGELLGLRWSDVDLDGGRLSVVQTLIMVDYKLTFSTPKTARGRRSVAMDAMTVAALRTHRARQLEERLACGPGYNKSNLVFCREGGAPVRPDWFSTEFEHHVKATGLPWIRLHGLRHTHASLALAANVHPKVVSERLGHSTIAMTLDTYSHAIPALQEEAAERVSRIVFGG